MGIGLDRGSAVAQKTYGQYSGTVSVRQAPVVDLVVRSFLLYASSPIPAIESSGRATLGRKRERVTR